MFISIEKKIDFYSKPKVEGISFIHKTPPANRILNGDILKTFLQRELANALMYTTPIQAHSPHPTDAKIQDNETKDIKIGKRVLMIHKGNLL